MQKKKLNIGFDIGVASVGWSLIDEDNNLIDLGVRLFEDPAATGELENQKRRTARLQRRRIRRIRNRKDILIKFLVDQGLAKSDDDIKNEIIKNNCSKYSKYKNPIEIKYHALNKKKISNEELIIILFHYIHHRGFTYLTDEIYELEKKRALENKDHNENKNKFPSEVIYDFYLKNGYYNGAPEKQIFSIREYENEIRTILNNLNKDEKFIEEYLRIFKLIRNFATGPGGKDSPTPYGLYRIEDGKVKKIGDNLWDVTIGRCTVYPDEFRGLKSSPIAELFNLTNDLNNLYFYKDRTSKLSKDEKIKLFNEINDSWKKNKAKNVTLKLIAKIKNEDITDEDISGYRGDEKKPEFTKLDNYRILFQFLLENNYLNAKDFDLTSIKSLTLANDLFKVISKDPNDKNKQKEYVKNVYPKATQSSIDVLIDKISKLSSTHSLSYKAMIEFITNCLFENINSSTHFYEKMKKNIEIRFKKGKYLNKESFDDSIISPTVRRSLRQTIKVFNKIIKLYSKKYEINNITIEMPRDKNTADQKIKLNKMMKKNRDKLANWASEAKIDLDKLKANVKQKISLCMDQDYLDIYDGEKINLDTLINQPGVYEIEHIIPYSISFDDSLNNKVLTKKHLNAEKSNLTPYQWLSQKGLYDKYKDRVLSNKNFSKRKRDNLLYENDPLKELQGFVGRNLADTRYASSEALNVFSSFAMMNHDLYPNMKIKVISGSVTNFINKSLFKFIKNRDLYYHHAVDATIVNFLSNNPKIDRLCKYYYFNDRYKEEGSKIIDRETGEILSVDGNDITGDLNQNNVVAQLKKQIIERIEPASVDKKVKYSRQIVHPKNKQLANETIYSVKWNDQDPSKCHIIKKIDLLGANTKMADLEKYFLNENNIESDKLLIFKLDSKLYKKLFDIFNHYYKLDPKKNPFIQFMQEQFKNEKPEWIQLDQQRIRKLRLIGDEKKDTNIIKLKSHSNNAILESLKPLGIRVYRSNDGKLKTIPINQKILKTDKNNQMIIDENKLFNVLEKNKISSKTFLLITNGTIFIDRITHELYYSNGGGNFNQNLIEIKPLEFNPKKQIQIVINTIIKNYWIAEIDELGNIYNKKEITVL
ncbi:MAG: type II CRISPR RNA-guided endonuclease Cas9 [Mycoplasmoidaceae bacterium]